MFEMLRTAGDRSARRAVNGDKHAYDIEIGRD